MKKIVFFDLDGTLLTDDKHVLEENKNAIIKAKEAGIEIVICTGRQANAAQEFKNMAESGKYVICTNGAEIVDIESGEELFACPIDENVIKYIFEIGKNANSVMKIDTKYARYITDTSYALNQEYEFNESDDFFEKNRVLQLSIGSKTKEKMEELAEQVLKIPGIKIENRYYNPLPSKDKAMWYLNVVNSSASKGNAVNGLCRFLKIDIKDAVCFGDDLNDISMIQMAGLGIAMENAKDIVKINAKKIIGNNNTPAIADVLYEMIEEVNGK